MGDRRSEYMILEQKPEEKRRLGRPRLRGEDGIKTAIPGVV
jgi:hypothetical protein